MRIERDHRVCFDPRLDLDARTPECIIDDLTVLHIAGQKTQGQPRRNFPADGRGYVGQAALACEEKVTFAVQWQDVETCQALVFQIGEPNVEIERVKPADDLRGCQRVDDVMNAGLRAGRLR